MKIVIVSVTFVLGIISTAAQAGIIQAPLWQQSMIRSQGNFRGAVYEFRRSGAFSPNYPGAKINGQMKFEGGIRPRRSR